MNIGISESEFRSGVSEKVRMNIRISESGNEIENKSENGNNNSENEK